MKIFFAEIENWEIDYIKTRLPNAELFFSEKKLDKDNLPEQVDFDVISAFVGSVIDEDVLKNFPNIKMVTTRSTGFDHLNLKALKEKNVKVGYVPGYGDNTVAEMAFGLILCLSRKIYEAYNRIKETGSFSFEGLCGFDLSGKTIGILGTGRIGKHMIKIAQGFGMNVIAFDLFPNEALTKEMNFKYLPLDELLATSDIISIHVPYCDSTHHLINSQNIGKIKKGALLINTARGGIIETDALVKALNDGVLGGAGLDVLEEENIIKDEKEFLLHGHPEGHNLKTVLANHVLIDMPNVIITPHNAFNTKEALQRILDTDIENIKNFMENGEPKFPVPES